MKTRISLTNEKISKIRSDWELVLLKKGQLKHDFVKETKILEAIGFKGAPEEVLELAEKKKIYVGVGGFGLEELSSAIAGAVRILKKRQAKSAKIALYFEKNQEETGLKAAAYGAILGSYSFDFYKSKKDKPTDLKLFVSTQNYYQRKIDLASAKKILKEAEIVAQAVNFTRQAVNLTPTDLNPVEFSKMARSLARQNKLEIKVYGEDYIKKNRMGAFWAVSRASIYPPQLIRLRYRGKSPRAKVCLVGKGLTYDTGGLSLKTGEGMYTMKMDMGGAAAILGAIKAVSELRLNLEVEAILGVCENAIGKDAYKPDDVLTAMNGKTIEVKNTDAEGRLVLADCLCLAQKQAPDYILDIATLTGASIVGLGEYTFGVMGYSQELKDSVRQASAWAGEFSADLPFNRFLEKLLNSEVADISNLGAGKYGGAITAALFLGYFVEEKYRDRWVHLDIAGPAYKEKPWGLNPFGASGSGVRTIVEWLKTLA